MTACAANANWRLKVGWTLVAQGGRTVLGASQPQPLAGMPWLVPVCRPPT